MTDETDKNPLLVGYLSEESNQDTVAQAIGSVGDSLAELADQKNTAVSAELGEIRTRLDGLDNLVTKQTQKINALDDELSSVESRLDEQNSLLSRLSEAVESLREELSSNDGSPKPNRSAPDDEQTAKRVKSSEHGSTTNEPSRDPVDVDGKIVLADDVSALFRLKVRPVQMDSKGNSHTVVRVKLVLRNGSGRAIISENGESETHQVSTRNGRIEFTSNLPKPLGVVTYRLESKSRQVKISGVTVNQRVEYELLESKSY